MKTANIAILVCTLAGCTGTPVAHLAVFDDRSDEHPDHEVETLDELPDVVVAACELLPIECVASAWHQTGIVQVHLLPDDMRRGRMIGGRACWRAVMARGSDPVGIAHELGHAFGLEHASEGLMEKFATGIEPGMTYVEALSDEQIDDVLRNAGALAACP